MKPKPNAKQITRATAQVRRDHEPRQLQHEPRLCLADEQNIADLVRFHERREARTEVQMRIAAIRHELELLTVKVGTAAAGNHRDAIRMVERGLNALERSVQ